MEIRSTYNTTFGNIPYGKTFEWKGNVYMPVDTEEKASFNVTQGFAVNIETGMLKSLYYDEPVSIRNFIALEEE